MCKGVCMYTDGCIHPLTHQTHTHASMSLNQGKSVFDAVDLITKDDKTDVTLTVQSKRDASTRCVRRRVWLCGFVAFSGTAAACSFLDLALPKPHRLIHPPHHPPRTERQHAGPAPAVRRGGGPRQVPGLQRGGRQVRA